MYFCQEHNSPSKLVFQFLCADSNQSPPNFQMAKYLSASASNEKPIGENCVPLLMCGCDIKVENQSSTKPFIWAGKCVRVSDRQQVPWVPGHHCGLWRPPIPSPSLSALFSLAPSSQFLLLSHSDLFPFDQIQAKTCRAIYRRAVLFYLLVSICGTQKYRGLPSSWRQQCSAAERWGGCERQREKERQKKVDQMTMTWERKGR